MVKPASRAETRSRPRVLQRVIFPTSRDMDVLPLYVDPDRPRLEADNTGLTTRQRNRLPPVESTAKEELDPHAVLGRHRYQVKPWDRISFGTYFNAFPASYWRRWTVIDVVTLRGRVTGEGATVVVYRSMPDGRAQRVDDRTATGGDTAEFSFELPLTSFADGGWYWFDIVAGAAGALLEEASWTAIPPAHNNSGTLTIGITTMNRPAFCAQLLTQLGADIDIQSVLDEVVVIEQGSDKVADDPGYRNADQLLRGKLRLLEQPNMGGSGGYARVQLETLKAKRSTYLLCMDDDVVCEPESVIRAVVFADLCRRPTIVGGHMFSLYAKARLHSFGEIVNRYRFWWMAPPGVYNDWDLGERNLRSTRWLHRRVDVDYSGWFMCLIPTHVLRTVGLSLPLFIKWDDAEFGLRSAKEGFPTVTLPGAAVWHVPWTDKNDALDWQAYFHQRNRIIAALLHSPYKHGGRVIRESFNHQVKHLLSMQYSTAELRHRAIEDVLAGPQRLHAELATTLPILRDVRGQYGDGRTSTDPDAFPPVRRERPPKRGHDPTLAKGKIAQIKSASKSAMRQAVPKRELAERYPEAHVPAMDAKWWMISQFDSVVVSLPDGASRAWYQRDRKEFDRLMRRTITVHQRLYRQWPQLASEYRQAVEGLTSPEQWSQTFEDAAYVE